MVIVGTSSDDEMRRRRDEGALARVRGQLPLAAVAFVVIALAALAFAPIAIIRELDGMRARTAATSDRAESLITQLRLYLAQEVEYHQGVRLGQSGSAQEYRQIRLREDSTFNMLDTVTDPIGPRFSGQMDSLRAVAARWHRLPDALVQGRMSNAAFVASLPTVRALSDSTLAALQGVETSVDVARTNDEAQGGRAIERQFVISLGVGLLALFGMGVVLWFARRDRALNRQLARALDEEAIARTESERRRMELERVTESRTRLMRGFSHDVKNPIGAADGYMQLLEDELMGPLTTQQSASIGRARRSLAQALRLIEDLLQLARAERAQLDVKSESVNLTDLARDATEEFRAQAEQKGLALELDQTADGVVVQSDPARVRQVLSNLVSNAVKYTNHGRVTVRVLADGRRGAIEVADTGTGIPADRQPLVFDEFVRLDPHAAPGAGVGLAISQRIVQALGGEITLTSEAGHGSRFVLWLPTSGAVSSDGSSRPVGAAPSLPEQSRR
jgi:signal transduction histidine kinase